MPVFGHQGGCAILPPYLAGSAPCRPAGPSTIGSSIGSSTMRIPTYAPLSRERGWSRCEHAEGVRSLRSEYFFDDPDPKARIRSEFQLFNSWRQYETAKTYAASCGARGCGHRGCGHPGFYCRVLGFQRGQTVPEQAPYVFSGSLPRDRYDGIVTTRSLRRDRYEWTGRDLLQP